MVDAGMKYFSSSEEQIIELQCVQIRDVSLFLHYMGRMRWRLWQAQRSARDVVKARQK